MADRGMELATAYVSLVASTGSLARSTTKEFSAVEKQAGSSGRRAGDQFSQGMGGSIRSRAASIFTPLKVGAGILGGLAVAGGKFGLEIAAGNENAQISFTTMLGSAQKAQTFLGKLQKFAANTPFEFPELQTAASSLISIGIDADKVIPIMTSLGNATSGMGTGAEGVKRATIALQQMNAAGRITAEDLNQLRDAGIPVYDLLAKATGKSVKQVAEMAQKGKLGRQELEQLMKALETGKGLERFNGLMDKQSASLNGMISTLKDTLGQGLANALQPLLPFIKSGIGEISERAAVWLPKLGAGLANVIKQAPAYIAHLKSIKDGAQALYDLVVKGDYGPGLRKAFGWDEDNPTVDRILSIRDAVMGFIDTVKSDGGMSTVNSLFERLGPLLNGLKANMPLVNATVDIAGKVFQFLGDHVDDVINLLPALLAGFAAYKALQVANNAVGKESLIGFGLQIGSTVALTASNFALAKSQRAVATSTVESTTATNVGTIARARQTAATVLATTRGLILAGAQRAITAGQWLMNAAMSANPLGLVVIALAALGTALYIAWNKSETFRKIVLGAWDGIKKGIGTALGWVSKTVPAVWDTVYSSVKKAGYRVLQFIQENLIDKINGLMTFLHIPLHISPIWTPNSQAMAFSRGAGSANAAERGGFKDGGVMPGYTPGRDVHKFYSRTAGSLELSGGEAFMVPEFTRMVGGKAGIAKLNKAARRGQKFADGGVFGAIGNVVSSVWDFVTNPGNKIKELMDAVLSRVGDNPVARIAGGAVKLLVGGLIDKVTNLFGGSGQGTIPPGTGVNINGKRVDADTARRLRAAGGDIRVIQGSWSNDPRSFGTHLGSGVVDLITNSWMPTVARLRAQGLLAMFRNWPGNQHIHAVNPFVQGLSPQAQAQVRRARANSGIFANGGVFDPIRLASFDTGGFLEPGWTLAHNGLGRDEPVRVGDAAEVAPEKVYDAIYRGARDGMRERDRAARQADRQARGLGG